MLSYTEIWTLVNQWHISMRVTRLRNLALLVEGIIHSRSGCLSAIVRQWSIGPRRHIHRLKRLHRFLKNPQVHALPVFRSMAALVWRYRPGGKRTRMLPVAIDWTKVHDVSVLFAAVPRRRRALPLAFGAYRAHRLRHSQNKIEQGCCLLVASILPDDAQPLFLADAGFGRTEFIRWLQQQGFAYVVRLRPNTHIHYRGRTFPLSELDTAEGLPTFFASIQYRATHPVTVHIVVSRKGNQVWYLATSFEDAEQTVAWYKKRFWIEEMFRDFKSTLGLRQAHLADENRLKRLLLGYQVAYMILSLIGFHVPRRWHHYFSSRRRLSTIWLALQSLPRFRKPRHRKVWRRRIWPKLLLESG
jgi:hypothetical protein